MTLISIDTAHHYTWGQDADGWHLVQTAELSVIQERMPPGTAEVRHSHRQARQGIEVAPGIAHQIRNNSQQDLEFLVVSQP
ncbi:MAG TPA: hypothetical protein VFT99_20450, partial [Roseiflexaceae bacterium]|nr:hypothetical protein [Roseiflexaceae bacterium]